MSTSSRFHARASNCSDQRGLSHTPRVVLRPVTPHLVGYGEAGQAKWAAWRRKEHLESVCEENLDDQADLVASYLDPIFTLGPG